MAQPQPTSPLKLVAAPPPPPASAPGWIDLKEAARRSGWDEGYLRRRCSDDKRCATWQSVGLARQERPSEGGQLRWLVHESADAKLAPVKTAEQLADAFDLRTLSAAQQAAVLNKERAVLDLERALGEATAAGGDREAAVEVTALRLSREGVVSVSARTLYRWLSDYRKAGLRGLVDERAKGVRRPPAAPPDPFLLEVQRLYLSQQHRSMQVAYDRAKEDAAADGRPFCSYKTACRFLLRIPKKTRALYRGGDEAFAAAASCSTRDYTTIDSNDVWVGDHHRLDVICQLPDGGKVRPWLTAWMDMRSRKIVGWRIFAHDPNADEILSSFRDGVGTHGAPLNVHIDNGRDYDSFALQGRTKRQRRRGEVPPLVGAGVFERLGVGVIHAQPYRPQSKTIERFFGTVAGRFSCLFETYCGRSPDDKPANLAEQLARGKAPTVEEVAAAFADWLDADYHHKAHLGDGMDGRTPAAVFASELKRKRVLSAALLEELSLERVVSKVGRNGVRWMHTTYGRDHPELVRRDGQQVLLGIDPKNLNLVRVYEPDGRWLCNVTPNEKLPVLAKKQDVRAVVAQQRRDRKTAKAYQQARPRLAMSVTDMLYRRAAEKRAAEAPPPPEDGGPTLLPVRSPIEDQLPAIRAALEGQALRPAVGAESSAAVTFRDIGKWLDRKAEERAAAEEPLPDTFSALREWSERQRVQRQEASDE